MSCAHGHEHEKNEEITCAKACASLFVDFGPCARFFIGFLAMCMKFGRYFIVKIVISATFLSSIFH